MCDRFTDALCQYQSIRFITVKNKKLATIYYLILLFVLAYVIGYTIIANKGYQAIDDVSGSTSIKIKGSGSIGRGASLLPLDSMDLVNPSSELNAFFMTTAITSTRNQTQTTCDGDEDAPLCTHTNTSNCTQEYFSSNAQGIYTGNCGSNNRCQLFTWCPVEDDSVMDVVENVGNFTVFIKIDVSFDRFGVKRTNTYDYLGSGKPVFGLNLFTINEMLTEATDGKVTDYKEIAETGAILLVSSKWNCDFDSNLNNCNPIFKFSRVDDVPHTISYGFNFRTVSYDVSKKYRLLEKLHGLRVMFIVEGSGRKFNFAALTVTLGAGLAYLSLAKVITDIILEKFMGKDSERYASFKYHEIEDNEMYGVDETIYTKQINENDQRYQTVSSI